MATKSIISNRISSGSPFRQEDERSGIFRGDGNGLLPRSKSQEICLSRSLGALHRHLSVDEGRPSIYFSGYLLKRSNHPVSQEQQQLLSPEQQQQQQQSSHMIRKGPLHATPDVALSARSGELEVDVFAADWEDEEEEEDGFPALPLDLSIQASGTPALLSPRKSSSFLAEATPAESVVTEQTASLSYFEEDETAARYLSSSFVPQQHSVGGDELSSPLLFMAPRHPEEELKSGQASSSTSQPEEEEQDEDPLRECFWKMLSDFFGVPTPVITAPPASSCCSTPKQSTSNLQQASAAEPALVSNPTVISPKRSAPIKMPSSHNNHHASTPSSHLHNTTNTAQHSENNEAQHPPQLPPQRQQQPPPDIIDEKGHVWRAKFCILQDAVLYFYRNKEDAECSEAKAERAAESTTSPSTSPFFPRGAGDTATVTTSTNTAAATQESLARSPIPRKYILSSSFIGNMGGSVGGPYNIHLWEKRTPLAMIGAVHNAEAEYGSHCFALLSPPRDEDDSSGDEDESADSNSNATSSSSTTNSSTNACAKESARDKLILRAPNGEEMGQWMFQFHCSIRSYVQDMILKQRSSPYYPVPQSTFYAHTTNSNNNNTMNLASPLLSPRTVTLSHGHGRTLARRRRVPPYVDGKSSSKDDSSFLSPPRSRRLKQRSEDALQWFTGADFFPPERAASTSTATTVSTSASLLGSPVRRVAPSPTSVAAATAAAAAETNHSSSRTESQQQSIAFLERNDNISPELSAPPDPETERPMPDKKPIGGKYVPPHLRRQQQQQHPTKPPPTPKDENKQHTPKPVVRSKYVPPHLRKGGGGKPKFKACAPPPEDEDGVRDTMPLPLDEILPLKLGGCADPRVVAGSIMDANFIPRKASKLKRELRTNPYGYSHKPSGSVTWDIGAVSECGIRDSNEDSYVVAGDLLKVLGTNGHQSLLHKYSQDHTPGLFCIFDGHLGDQAARYAAERLTSFLSTESLDQTAGVSQEHEEAPAFVERVVRKAFEKLDEEFCEFCVEGDREWESGTTALVAALVDNHLVIANLGDARAVACRSVDTHSHASELQKDGWSRLPESDSANGKRRCLWKEVSETHSPSRDDERERIEKANGWITYEEQIPIAQLHRLNLQDDDVFDILQRCFADRYDSPSKAAAPNRVVKISRVCGELAVSRALGDRDFKAAFNDSSEVGSWDSPLFLFFPDDHTKMFQGDLVLSTPEFSALRVRESGVYEEFFLFACDGLWDVMDADDAVRVTRDLLFEKKWPARKAAARLAELAVHLGSSDNITVIVVAFSN